ncbi:ankyrin [Hypoxylon sp. FL1150]|nr:ankyrin [Hypoxylon sp. FL1150]
MDLSRFPPEIAGQIFQYIVLSRELSRAMRVRFVSRQFRNYIDDAISDLRLLGWYVGPPYCIENLPKPLQLHDQQKAWLPYVCSYLARQAAKERFTTSLLGRLYRVAEAICEEDGNAESEAISACLKSLISLLADQRRCRELFQEPTNQPVKDPDAGFERDVAVAAVYLGRKTHVDRLLAEAPPWWLEPMDGGFNITSTVFGSAFQVATRQGNLEIIKSFLSGPLSGFCQRGLLDGASTYGHRAVSDFALDARPISLPEGDVERRLNTDYPTVIHALRETPWPDQYERLAEILGPDSDIFRPYHISQDSWLHRSAAAGKVEMVRHFLAKGAFPNPLDTSVRRGRVCRPLVEAVRRSDTIARILLDAGADPNLSPPPRTALMQAAWTGNVSTVKLLLDYGAEVNVGSPPPIVLAIFKEDLAMFRLLRERGARLDTPDTGGWAMALARLHGLESMVDLLVREGVGRDVVMHHVGWYDETYWWYKRLWPVSTRYRPRPDGLNWREQHLGRGMLALWLTWALAKTKSARRSSIPHPPFFSHSFSFSLLSLLPISISSQNASHSITLAWSS